MGIVIAFARIIAFHNIRLRVKYGADLVAFPYPNDHRVALPFADLDICGMVVLFGKFFVVEAVFFKQVRIPNFVQARILIFESKLNIVSAPVLRPRNVHRLVSVANKVNQVFKGVNPLPLRRAGILQQVFSRQDAGINVSCLHVFYLLFKFGIIKPGWQIHKMKWRCRGFSLPDIIGPAAYVRQAFVA